MVAVTNRLGCRIDRRKRLSHLTVERPRSLVLPSIIFFVRRDDFHPFGVREEAGVCGCRDAWQAVSPATHPKEAAAEWN